MAKTRKAPRVLAKRKKSAKPKRATRTQASPTTRHSERLLETGGTVIEDLRLVRFAGVSLGGGKTDKTAVAVLEYYPERKRVFLRALRDKISQKGEVSGDEELFDILNREERNLNTVAFDVPLQMPVCVRCELICPGTEKCTEGAVKWMREVHKNRDKHKRPNKMFTPYTERASEIYIANELEEPFHPSHALGANAAPLAARAHFLQRRLPDLAMIEVFAKLSLWRIGLALDIPKSHLRFHKHSVDSDEARLFILKTLIEKDIAFIYHQDMRLMVEDNTAFEAFVCALTAFLKFRGQTEKSPSGFPKGELWIDFPVQKIRWF
jgi:hypothetical protein